MCRFAQAVHSERGLRGAPAERAAEQHADAHDLLHHHEAAARRAAALVLVDVPGAGCGGVAASALLLRVGQHQLVGVVPRPRAPSARVAPNRSVPRAGPRRRRSLGNATTSASCCSSTTRTTCGTSCPPSLSISRSTFCSHGTMAFPPSGEQTSQYFNFYQ